MVKAYLYKYTLIIIILQSLIINAHSNEINNLFYKLGYMKKERYSLSISYSSYFNNNNFTINSINNSSLSNIGYNLETNVDNINKKSNGIHTEFGIQVLPPLKIFINYNYKITNTDIKYTIPSANFFLINRDYTSKYSIQDEEHTLMGGAELSYEYKYKKFIPYINFISAFGVTASSNYENIFYSINMALQTGLKYQINNNILLNFYTGVDYTSFYNGSFMKDRVTINIPQDYTISNILLQNINAEFIYEENYKNNINMLLGLELSLYKHYNIFISTKFINNFLINVGVKFQW